MSDLWTGLEIKSFVQKMSFVGVRKLSGAVCLISLTKEMAFALIMVWLVAEINVPMALVLLLLHDLSHVHSYKPYTVVTLFLAFWW